MAHIPFHGYSKSVVLPLKKSFIDPLLFEPIPFLEYRNIALTDIFDGSNTDNENSDILSGTMLVSLFSGQITALVVLICYSLCVYLAGVNLFFYRKNVFGHS